MFGFHVNFQGCTISVFLLKLIVLMACFFPGNDAMNLLPDGQQILGDKIGVIKRSQDAPERPGSGSHNSAFQVIR